MFANNSPASDALVVNRFVNISTAMIDPPNRYNSTIWNAPRIISGSVHSITPPGRGSDTDTNK